MVDDDLIEAGLEEKFQARFTITEKGLAEAERLRLLYNHMKEISTLSVDELRLELAIWKKIAEFLDIWYGMDVAERTHALSLMAEHGIPGAKERLEKISEIWFRKEAEKKAEE